MRWSGDLRLRVATAPDGGTRRRRRGASAGARARVRRASTPRRSRWPSSELATNLVRYAPRGRDPAPSARRGRAARASRSRAATAGPGIADSTRALQDGFSTGGGLGSGLPAVRRLMDEFEIVRSRPARTSIARKWPPRRSRSAGRPTVPGETVNGDAWHVDRHGGACRIAVIDGLGHGRSGRGGGRRPWRSSAHQPELAPTTRCEACHRALGRRAGAAISVARSTSSAARCLRRRRQRRGAALAGRSRHGAWSPTAASSARAADVARLRATALAPAGCC